MKRNSPSPRLPLRVGLALTLLLLLQTGVHAQLVGSGKIDYEKIFREGLSKNGKTLNLGGKKIGDEGIRRLVSLDILKSVTKLDLRWNKISATGVEILAQSENLSQLKSLEMRHNMFGDKGAAAIANAKAFSKLKDLRLGWCEIRDGGALALAKSTRLPKLQKLDLRGNFLAEKTKKTLNATLSHLKSLKLF